MESVHDMVWACSVYNLQREWAVSTSAARVFLVFLYTLPPLIRGREGTETGYASCCCCFFCCCSFVCLLYSRLFPDAVMAISPLVRLRRSLHLVTWPTLSDGEMLHKLGYLDDLVASSTLLGVFFFPWVFLSGERPLTFTLTLPLTHSLSFRKSQLGMDSRPL